MPILLQANLAKKIVQEVRKLLDEEIVLMDTNGVIMASTNNTRIGNFHEGAMITCKSKRKLIISKDDEQTLKGVKAGINLPIFSDQNVVGVIGITGDPMAVSRYGELLRKMTELLIKESIFMEEAERHIRSMEAFVFDWLELREWDSSFMNRAERLGINLSIQRQIVLIKILNSTSSQHKTIEKWNGSFGSEDILVRWGQDRFLLLLNTENHFDKKYLNHRLSDWKNRINEDVLFGVGNVTSAKDLKKSFLQAERALHSVKLNQWIVFDDELTLEMIVDDLRSETKTLFVERTIKPILQDQELVETIKTLFDNNHSIKETSSQLHIHINTLHYRLKKIEELTGLNPKWSKDQVILYLALQFIDK
jgi:carbohydrate diacid regulator